MFSSCKLLVNTKRPRIPTPGSSIFTEISCKFTYNSLFSRKLKPHSIANFCWTKLVPLFQDPETPQKNNTKQTLYCFLMVGVWEEPASLELSKYVWPWRCSSSGRWPGQPVYFLYLPCHSPDIYWTVLFITRTWKRIIKFPSAAHRLTQFGLFTADPIVLFMWVATCL